MLPLSEQETKEISEILVSLQRRYGSAEDQEFLLSAAVHARRLPPRLQEYLNTFRRQESGYVIISGHPIDDEAVGPTPGHWNQLPSPSPTLEQDQLLVLYAALLGDVFGWATQQDGRVVHDVLPIKENEGEQLGTAADVLLSWHTEDAFHPHRPDWVILACIRNPTDTPTTVARADDLELDEHDVAVLFEPRFRIAPDNSHLPQHNSTEGLANFEAIEELRVSPPAIPLMWGDPSHPYIRADEDFWDVHDPADVEARSVLRRFTMEIEQRLHDVVLRPGDYCFLDNFKAVHGRRPFPARYDGTDRWLKRVCVTRDLRKSRGQRQSLLSQILG